MPKTYTPEKIAQMSVDALCAYDFENNDGDIQTTKLRAARFMSEFVMLITSRLEQAVKQEPVD
jgi:hypothetical protein